MKKAVFVLILSLFITAAIFFTMQFLFGQTNSTGELQITSQPSAKVYLNNKFIGNTPICRCDNSKTGNVLPTGGYMISINPIQGSSAPFAQHITIGKGVLTVVDYTFGPPGQSSGSVLELTPADNPSANSLLLTSFPSSAEVFLDDNSIGKTPLSYSNPTVSDHKLVVQKTGYTDKTLHINTPNGYVLQAIVYLAVTNQPASASNSATLSASASAQLFPSPIVAKVTILSTPTGFLRVRADASLGSPEVGQVKPGDSLYLLNEKNGWYEVKLSENKIGWISAQYAQKN